MYTQVYDVDEKTTIQLPRFPHKGRLVLTYISDEDDAMCTPSELFDPYKNPIVFVAKNWDESKQFLDSLKKQK